MKKNTVILLSYYLTLLNISFNPLGVSNFFFLILPFIIIFLISVFYSNKYLVLSTLITYPFIFLIRNSTDHIILILLPEIIIFTSFAFSLVQNKIRLYTVDNKTLSLLFLFLLLSLTIGTYHVGRIDYVPVFIRIYFFPLLFFFTISSYIKSNNKELLEFLYIGILSFGIVSIIAIISYFDLINLKNFQNIEISKRQIYLYYKISRLDLLLSGAFGSAGAIVLALGFVLMYLKEENFFKKSNTYLGIILFFSGLLTLSYSVIIVFILIFFITILFKNKNFLTKIAVLFLIFFMLNYNFILNLSVVEYALNFHLKFYINYFTHINLREFLIGAGTPINMGSYLYQPTRYISDIGILRVFTENGIVTFLVLLFFIIRIFRKILHLYSNFDSRYYDVLFILFLLFMLLPHTKTIILPPFYTIFMIVIFGIMHEYKLKKLPNKKI
jgi:hypothetical protein